MYFWSIYKYCVQKAKHILLFYCYKVFYKATLFELNVFNYIPKGDNNARNYIENIVRKIKLNQVSYRVNKKQVLFYVIMFSLVTETNLYKL